MPWRPEDAPRHTRKADTDALRRMWSEVANKVLEETGDEGRAVRTANGIVALRAKRQPGTSGLSSSSKPDSH
jgi:hypothetical protein